MRFMSLYKPGKESNAPPTQQEMTEMGNLIEEMSRAGVLISTGGLLPSAKGSRVQIDGGKFTVTDGPFTETKELIAGYAIIEVNSQEEAVELAKRFLSVVGEGVSEVRQMFEDGDCGGGFTNEAAEQGHSAPQLAANARR